MLPLLAGIAFAKVRDLFSNVYVLSTIRTEGLMKANSLGRKVPEAIVWLVPYALSIAMFPFLCELVDKNEKDRLGHVVTQSCRLVLSVFIPFAVLCAVLAHPIAGLLFSGDNTPPEVTRWIGVSLACYVFILPTRAVEQVLIQAYFANRRTLAVTVMGIGFSTVTIVVGYIGIVVFRATGAAALAVVALGLVAGRVMKAIAFVWVMKRDIGMFPARETLVFLVRMLVVSAGVGLSGFLGLRGFEAAISSTGTVPVLLMKLCAAAAAGAALFVVLTRLLHVGEPGLMLRWAIEKLRKQGEKAHA
jgi:peptidoglycan biosynthesis protein MviN/MurJ (putative lipid II flippase)